MARYLDSDGDEPRQLVTMTEVAKLAGVHRPTVSNWRRRHKSFPRPVEDDGVQPLFDADQLAGWLDGRGVPGAAPQTYGDRFKEGIRLRALTELKGVLPGDQLLMAGVALCTLRSITGSPLEGVDQVQGLAQSVERKRSELRSVLTPDTDRLSIDTEPLVVAVNHMCDASDPAAVAERLVAEAERLGSGLRASITPANVAEIVAGVVGDVTGQIVYDPAAGSGSLLLRVLANGRAASVQAADLDGDALRLLRQRFILHRIAANVTYQDSLAARHWHGAQVVIADPPFIGSEEHLGAGGRNLFRWIRYAHGQLVPGGRAVVVLPTWALRLAGPRQARSRPDDSPTRPWHALVDVGAVRAVVQLPRRSHSFRTAADLALVVLGRSSDGQPDDSVLLCDLERAPGKVAAAVGVHTWLTTGQVELPSECAREVSASELLRAPSLLPSRFLTSVEGEVSVSQFESAVADWIAAQGDPNPIDLPHFITPDKPVAYTTVAEQIDAGQLALLPGHRVPVSDVGATGKIEVIGAPEVTGECSVGTRRASEAGMDALRAAYLTSPGDVVILPTDPLRALIDSTGGRLVQSPAQVIRILRGDGPGRLTPHVLVAMLKAPRNATRARGSVVRRLDLKAAELPLLPSDELHRVDQLLRTLAQQQQHVAGRLAALERLVNTVGAGVADGALTVGGGTHVLPDQVEEEMRDSGGTA